MPRRKSYIEQATVFDTVAKPSGYDALPRLQRHYVRQTAKAAYDIARGRNETHNVAALLAGEAARSSARYYMQAIAQHEKARRCGAKTRRGTACQCKPMPDKDRCKIHGGASTGPRTLAGRVKALSCLIQYKARPDLLSAKIKSLNIEFQEDKLAREAI